MVSPSCAPSPSPPRSPGSSRQSLNAALQRLIAGRKRRRGDEVVVKHDAQLFKNPSVRERLLRPPPFEFSEQTDCKSFSKQQQAFDWIAERTRGIIGCELLRWKVLSYETNASGKRRFLACKWDAFEKMYLGQPSCAAQHWYEIIREGAPCRIYFDLEFSKIDFPEANPKLNVAAWLKIVEGVLRRDLNISITEENILTLESSTESKFSQHIIIHLPRGQLFASNVDLGRFVKSLATEAREREDTSAFCWLGGDTCIADLGVYTRNRCFRLFLSSKFGKRGAQLKVASNSAFKNRSTSPRQLLRDSLVVPLTMPDEGVPLLAYPSLIACDEQIPRRKPHNAVVKNSLHPSTTSLPSPFPGVDKFVSDTCLDTNGSRGYLRGCKTSSDSTSVIYDVGGNRFCHNIGREHSSNHIYIVVNLIEGTVRQKCHDPCCRGYSFLCSQLPDSLLEEHQFDAIARRALLSNPDLP